MCDSEGGDKQNSKKQETESIINPSTGVFVKIPWNY